MKENAPVGGPEEIGHLEGTAPKRYLVMIGTAFDVECDILVYKFLEDESGDDEKVKEYFIDVLRKEADAKDAKVSIHYIVSSMTPLTMAPNS